MTKIYVDINHVKDVIVLPRLKYTLDFIQNHPCAPENIKWIHDPYLADVTIQYGFPNSSLSIPFINFCFCDDHSQIPKHINDAWKDIIISGFTSEKITNGYSSPVDIFQTIFYHISRYEEWYNKSAQTDIHGLMPSKDHFLVNQGIHDIPVVDYLVYYFYDLIGQKPKKLESLYILTHDIDAIRRFPSFYKFLRAIANVIFYQQFKWTKLLKLFSNFIKVLIDKEADPYDTFDWLLHTNHPKIVERKIYFLSGGKTKFENYYRISDPRCRPVYELCRKNGYEFGIHPSYLSGDNDQIILSEKSFLEKTTGQKIDHSRQHFLRYKIKSTGKILESLGIETDSSFGYRDKTGFRCGTGFPYRMYNFDEERPYTFLEIPLIVMDMSIIHEFGWDADQFIRHLEAFLEKNKYYTQITFNFHNSTFDPTLIDAVKMKAHYLKLFT